MGEGLPGRINEITKRWLRIETLEPMLIKRDALEGIRDGTVSVQFRRWARPRVKVGTVLRTSIGLVRVTEVEGVQPEDVTGADARQAGAADVSEIVDAYPDRAGDLYRIGLVYVGPDPRVSLRKEPVTDEELPELIMAIDRFDRSSKWGAWTRPTLALIAERPGVRAETLASELGWEKRPFKANVRKLKDLGLTESLETGYRLSVRGRSLLEHLRP